MTANEEYEANIIKSLESFDPAKSEEYFKGFHPTDTNLRVNEEDVTFTVFNDIVMKHQQNILRSKNKILAIIKNYLAKNSSKLGVRSPTCKVTFLPSDKKALFNAVGIKEEDLYKSLQSIDANDIDVSNHLVEDSFVSLCVIICGVFLKNDKKLLQRVKECDVKPLSREEKYNNDNPVYFVSLYLAIRFYGALYMKYWRVADPNEQIMDYTIENMSGKFLIKKFQNILEFIQYHSETNVENMWDRLIRMSDVDIVYYASDLHNRLSHSIKTIANNYYKNKEENNRIGSDDANKKGEDGKAYTGDVSSISSDLVFSVRKVINAFYTETVIDPQLLTMACNRTKLSQSRMLLILKALRENKKSEPRIKSLFNDIISYYLTTLQGRIDELRSSKFAVAMIKAYSVSNTKDPFVLGIKDCLNKLITENLQTIVDVGNANLIDRCRNSIYTYFVLFIAKTIN